ncbi:hypothetical protein AGMMS50233_10470 [Endomicrobiia bacterium]|nr:hypothetical protein AGMMS50233_10470 [Endomicrobiia bacterium]
MTKPDFAKLDNVFQRHGVTPIDPKELSSKETLQTDKSTNQQADKLVKWTTYILKTKRRLLEEVAFYDEKNVYEIVDEAVSDYLVKRKKLKKR